MVIQKKDEIEAAAAQPVTPSRIHLDQIARCLSLKAFPENGGIGLAMQQAFALQYSPHRRARQRTQKSVACEFCEPLAIIVLVFAFLGDEIFPYIPADAIPCDLLFG